MEQDIFFSTVTSLHVLNQELWYGLEYLCGFSRSLSTTTCVTTLQLMPLSMIKLQMFPAIIHFEWNIFVCSQSSFSCSLGAKRDHWMIRLSLESPYVISFPLKVSSPFSSSGASSSSRARFTHWLGHSDVVWPNLLQQKHFKLCLAGWPKLTAIKRAWKQTARIQTFLRSLQLKNSYNRKCSCGKCSYWLN